MEPFSACAIAFGIPLLFVLVGIGTAKLFQANDDKIIRDAYHVSREYGRDVEAQLARLRGTKPPPGHVQVGWKLDADGVRSIPDYRGGETDEQPKIPLKALLIVGLLTVPVCLLAIALAARDKEAGAMLVTAYQAATATPLPSDLPVKSGCLPIACLVLLAIVALA